MGASLEGKQRVHPYETTGFGAMAVGLNRVERRCWPVLLVAGEVTNARDFSAVMWLLKVLVWYDH